MKNVSEISELRQVGFYELKRLLGLGDERLKMILTVGDIKPKLFTDAKKEKTDELYNLFEVKEALRALTGRDVQQEYERMKRLQAMDPGTRAKFENVILRLEKSRNKKTG